MKSNYEIFVSAPLLYFIILLLDKKWGCDSVFFFSFSCWFGWGYSFWFSAQRTQKSTFHFGATVSCTILRFGVCHFDPGRNRKYSLARLEYKQNRRKQKIQKQPNGYKYYILYGFGFFFLVFIFIKSGPIEAGWEMESERHPDGFLTLQLFWAGAQLFAVVLTNIWRTETMDWRLAILIVGLDIFRLCPCVFRFIFIMAWYSLLLFLLFLLAESARIILWLVSAILFIQPLCGWMDQVFMIFWGRYFRYFYLLNGKPILFTSKFIWEATAKEKKNNRSTWHILGVLRYFNFGAGSWCFRISLFPIFLFWFFYFHCMDAGVTICLWKYVTHRIIDLKDNV